jgi:TonB family protein
MKAHDLSLFFAGLLIAACIPFAAQAQTETLPQKLDQAANQGVALKLIKSPVAPYPDEALKKDIEGRVTVSFVVDAKGHVSDAKPLSGPPELFQAAIDSVEQWQYEPPAIAPVTTTIEIAYGHPHDCPGSIADMAYVNASGRLMNQRGTVLDVKDSNWPLPQYSVEEARAGIAGEMILSVTVNAQGKVTKVRVLKSVSPHLDKAAAKTVRKWRYKLREGSLNSLPDDFELRITYKSMCNMQS